MKRLTMKSLVAAMMLSTLAMACGGGDKQPDNVPAESNIAAPQTKSIVLFRYKFNPSNLSVPTGTTVVFQNKDPEQATVTISQLNIDQILKPNTEFSYTFSAPGSYTITNRMARTPMQATINVQ